MNRINGNVILYRFNNRSLYITSAVKFFKPLKNNRVIDCLLQVHIAQEETKFGFSKEELDALNGLEELKNVRVVGLMGMASFTENKDEVRKEFHYLKKLSDKYASRQHANCQLQILSMGMSDDYTIALEEGSNLVRIGSLIFGQRN